MQHVVKPVVFPAALNGEQVGRTGNTGRDPREQPKHTFSAWNTFRVNEDFGFGLGVIYQDESFVTNDNAVQIPSYVRVDASAYYNFANNWRLQAKIENLLDREYFPNGHNADNITVGEDINATFTLSKSF